jgi:1-acyl-sn-glycerol-3-phosphate acyltransferase
VDRKAFGVAVDLLNHGKSVVIFPEGTRTPDGHLQKGKPGIGVIIAEARCPVVPVYISGTFEVLPVGAKWLRCRPVRVVFGAPLEFTQELKRYQGKELYQQINQQVMDRISDLSRMGKSESSTSLT